MFQLFVIAMLLAALGASGIFRSLTAASRTTRPGAPRRLPPARRPHPQPRRAVRPRRPAAPRTGARPQAKRRTPAPSPQGARLREVQPEETIVPRRQLHQLTARLDRLETALSGRSDRPASTQTFVPDQEAFAPQRGSLREKVFILMERGFGVDSVARQLRVSRAEVDLVLRMMALHDRRPELSARPVGAQPPAAVGPSERPLKAELATQPVRLRRSSSSDESLPVHTMQRTGVTT